MLKNTMIPPSLPFYENKALFPTDLALRFWGEAALIAAYTINRVPSPLLGNLTPYEHLYGTPPDYHSLRVFGCACFVLLQPHERTKLEPRSRLCYFLGYLSSSSTPPYLTDPSIELFLEDVDVPADPPDDTLHVAPPPIVYPVESSSTDPAPLVPPPVHLPSDLPVRRSTRVREVPSYLRDYHCFSTVVAQYEPRSYREASTNPLWQQAMTEELQALDRMHTLGTLLIFLLANLLFGVAGFIRSRLALMTKYASDLLTRAGLSDCKTASIPLEANARLTSLDGDLLSDAALYRQLVGSLIYLTVIRPDIAHAVHLVSQFMSAPRSTHYAAVLRILRTWASVILGLLYFIVTIFHERYSF
ncbi:hypothetical protein Acr_08g0011900 [Actinidia rufa]|uniref:Retroviral polymerase SH3-like domain-containing protein n=1 Tax=Actinidia rufa TaxID=165716 RepID=A0A7J0F286_9ERIC|nr:hypothetical protein Acr_08g0011900 [Actinidia rufa]